jgi:ATP-binding cassette subfamily B multidrug efflux pump
MGLADWRLAIPRRCGLPAYVVFLRHFVPRMRDLAKASSEVRSQVMGRVVDSYTNILTVKLFARARRGRLRARGVDEHTGSHRRAHALITPSWPRCRC